MDYSTLQNKKMKQTPFFSIITVCYNAADTIEKTIQSVLNQTCKDFEYIVIDGASTDGTVDIVYSYNKQLSYFVSEPDKGIYDAMNKGIRASKGTYIAFMNANDWYETDALEIIMQRAKCGMPEILYGLVRQYDNGVHKGYIGTSGSFDPEELHFVNLYCHQGLFIKKTLFEQLGVYDTTYRILADYEWILNAHDMDINPVIVQQIVANYAMGGISSSQVSLEERYDIIAKHYRGHNRFADRLEQKRGIAEYNLMYMHTPEKMAALYPDCPCYIWGCGEYGDKSFRILQNAGVCIKGFLDRKQGADVYLEHEVINPSYFLQNAEAYLDSDAMLIVASEKYEEEMVKELQAAGISHSKYICMSEIFQNAYRFFER